MYHCTRCDTTLPVEQFVINRNKKICNLCCLSKRKEQAENNVRYVSMIYKDINVLMNKFISDVMYDNGIDHVMTIYDENRETCPCCIRDGWSKHDIEVGILYRNAVHEIRFFKGIGIFSYDKKTDTGIKLKRALPELIIMSKFGTDVLSYCITRDIKAFEGYRNYIASEKNEACPLCFDSCESCKVVCGRCHIGICVECFETTRDRDMWFCPYCKYTLKDHLESNGIKITPCKI